MKIAGLTMTDVWAHRVLRERGVETTQVDDNPAEIKVLVESINLAHHPAERNYRPYLHISGELRGVRADTRPYDVSEVTFPPDGGETIDAYYEFTDTQLAQLAQKGYFSSEFEPPAGLTGFEWDLPAQVDIVALAPQDENDVPVVFMRVRDAGSLVIDEASSGYELADYFADFSHEGNERIEQASVEVGLPQRSDAFNPLFTEEELAEDINFDEVAEAGPAPAVTTREGFEAQVQDVEARIEADSQRHREELEATEGTAENLYHERVARVLDESKSDVAVDGETEIEAEAEVAASGGTHDLDLNFGETEAETPRELVKLGRHSRGSSTIEETKAEVSRRAADLDHGPEDSDRQY